MNPIRERLKKSLAYLASEAIQLRYIVHGTVDEYLIPVEVLDGAVSDIEAVLSHEENRTQFNQEEIVVFERFLAEVGKLTVPVEDASVSNEELVGKNPMWAAARNAAAQYLVAMSFDLGQWEHDQLN
jgi:hypothetical protein